MSTLVRERPWPGLRGFGPLLLAGGLVAGCTSTATEEVGGTDDGPAAPIATDLSAVSTSIVDDGPPRVRDDDITDIAVLSDLVADGATGDPTWIAVVAELRARSWLASRYPGRYDLADIYDPRWAEATASAFEAEALDQGLYVDEPLPSLESVVVTREIGWIVEVEVTVVSEQAVIRSVTDDSVAGTLPGGRTRGLFGLGPATPDDSDRPWRIHSIVELLPADDSPDPSTEDDQ